MKTPDCSIVQLISAAAIQLEPINWIWDGWLAAGKLHLLAGAPGCGKTTLAMSLAAIVTRGGQWPDRSYAQPGNVVIWSGEDDPADTLLPRLLAAGADRSRVFFVGTAVDSRGGRPFDPSSDMAGLAEQIERVGNVALLIVDSVASAVNGDSYKNTEVRRGLQPLLDLGMTTDCAILGIVHFSKGSTGKPLSERILGSVAFGALARVVLAAAQIPGEGKGACVFCRGKSNIGPDGDGFSFHIEQGEVPNHPGLRASRVEWGPFRQGSAQQILAEAERELNPDQDENEASVDAWLRQLLTEEPEMTKAEVMSAARACGYTESTVQRARKRIGAHTEQRGYGKDKHAIWKLRARPEKPTTS